MSIINEAIKKARKEFETRNRQPSGNIADGESLLKTGLQSSERKWTAVIVASLTLVISLLGSIILYKHMTGFEASRNSDLHAIKQFYKKKRLFPLRVKGVMELNGIVYGPKEKWAIINNKIVREGDSLSGGRLAFIAEDFVKIEQNSGEEIVLDLR
ncbi:hypothetical protein ACFL0P_02215 [Candidatus Omnitrophota bacterium]